MKSIQLSNNILLLLLFFVFGKVSVSTAQQNLSKSKVAVSGYDLVSYHNSKPVKGVAKYEVTHEDAIYYFKDEVNKKVFQTNPEKYIPQYGGWCAYAMGLNGKKVSINPESYSLEEGKLYLFYKSAFNDTRKKWADNTEELKNKADQNWSDIIQKQ